MATVYVRKDITVEQMAELSETMAEIRCLKKRLSEIYDEKMQISEEMLEVSQQLDREINRYFSVKGREMPFTPQQLLPGMQVQQPHAKISHFIVLSNMPDQAGQTN